MVKIFGICTKHGIDVSDNSSRHPLDVDALLRAMSASFGFGDADRISHVSDDMVFGAGHLRIPSKDSKGIAYDDDVIVCFSGEIFDHRDHAKGSDADNFADNLSEERYILDAYRSYGTDFVKDLNGVFVIAIFDKRQNRLFIINDRYGMRPLYYHIDESGIVFASEIKAVIMDPRIDRIVDWDFWKDYFSYGYAIGNKTPLKDITALPNATILEFSDGKLSLHKYWDYDHIIVDHKRSREETIIEGVEVLKRVMQRQTDGLKRCMVFLSGGYDSRMIAAGIKQYSGIPGTDIKAFTIPKNDVGIRTFDDKDVRYSSQVSKILGIDHVIVGYEPRYFERYLEKFIYEQEGLCFENMWMIPLIGSLDAADSGLVNFDGIAGDVFLKAGYLLKPSVDYNNDLSNSRMTRKLDDEKLSIVIGEKLLGFSNVDIFSVMPFFNEDIQKRLDPDFDSIYEELRTIDGSENKVKVFQAKNRTKNAICLQPSNLIMRKNFSRMPFCDNEFVEFALSIPVDMKLRNDIYRKILDRSFPMLKDAPTTNDVVRMKDKFRHILIRNRLDFIRYSLNIFKAFRSKPKAHRKRISDTSKDIGFLVDLAKSMDMPGFIDKEMLIRRIDDDMRDGIDPCYFLEPLMQFCIWHRLFVDKEGHKLY